MLFNGHPELEACLEQRLWRVDQQLGNLGFARTKAQHHPHPHRGD
jgi:hypothetical protein